MDRPASTFDQLQAVDRSATATPDATTPRDMPTRPDGAAFRSPLWETLRLAVRHDALDNAARYLDETAAPYGGE